MKLSDAVLPPAPGLWVGEVGEGSRARPNLPYQDVSGNIFNEDVSFQSIIKGRVRSRGAAAADPRVQNQDVLHSSFMEVLHHLWEVPKSPGVKGEHPVLIGIVEIIPLYIQ